MDPESDTPDTTSAFRERLRREMLARREALEADAHRMLSARLAENLAQLLDILSPQTLSFCWPWRGEFDVRDLVLRWLAQDAARRAALPVIETLAAPMRFRAWSADTQLTEGRFGIQVPAEGAWLHPDLMLLPLVAMDADGYRLGYGGGYFDRTLAAAQPRPVAVGVGFAMQIVDSIAPQPWDERLDYAVTEEGLRAFKSAMGR